MESEFGIASKMNEVLKDFETADLLMAKNRAAPVFSSRETDTMFILSAHLKGYRRENIKVEIIEDWTIIRVSGEYPIQESVMVGTPRGKLKESVMVGREVIKKETTMRRFIKAFRIPAGVVMNKIKARFNKYESLLTISMPKSLREFKGVTIEEVEADEFVRHHADILLEIRVDEVSDQLPAGEETERKPGEEETQKQEDDEVNSDESKRGDKPCSRKICACCKLAGSALLVSIVVIAFHLIRSQNQQSKKKNKS